MSTCCVLHIITGLSTGGAEYALYNLLQGGLSAKCDSHVISLIDKGTMGERIEALGVPVTALGMKAGRPTLSSLVKLRTVIKRIRPDLIQGWMYHGNLAATLAHFFATGHPALAWNIRHSLYDISDEKPMTRLMIRVNRLFSFTADVLLYNSQLSRQQHEAFGFSSAKGQVIPNGIDVQSFCFSEQARKRIRSELGIPEDAQVVGHVARLHPMKDHPLFLQAASDIALHDSAVHFMLSGKDVTLDNVTLNQSIPAVLQNRFHLLGERSDVANLMSAVDILSSSSSYGEAFPNVLGEAMAVGLPCVATDVGDSALIVGDTGRVVKPRDKAALSGAIEALLALPTVEYQLLSKLARRRIEENFTLSVIVERYALLYRKLGDG